MTFEKSDPWRGAPLCQSHCIVKIYVWGKILLSDGCYLLLHYFILYMCIYIDMYELSHAIEFPLVVGTRHADRRLWKRNLFTNQVYTFFIQLRWGSFFTLYCVERWLWYVVDIYNIYIFSDIFYNVDIDSQVRPCWWWWKKRIHVCVAEELIFTSFIEWQYIITTIEITMIL